jgi:hypothetical protein
LKLIELSVKSSKERIETVSLLKTGNKVVEDIVKYRMRRGQQWEANWVPVLNG